MYIVNCNKVTKLLNMEPTASEEFPILFGYVVGVSIRLFYYFIYIIDYWINWFLIIKYAFGPPLILKGFTRGLNGSDTEFAIMHLIRVREREREVGGHFAGIFSRPIYRPVSLLYTSIADSRINTRE